MPVRSYGVPGRSLKSRGVEFALEERTHKVRLVGQAYFLENQVTPFDENLVRELRIFDPGAIPFHRVMAFESTKFDPFGMPEEILCHNWGISRYSTKEPLEAEWKRSLLAKATKPRTGLLSTFETPNLVDVFFPLIGMDEHGLPPEYVPFDALALQVLRETLWSREQVRDHDPLLAWKIANDATQAERNKRGNAILDEAGNEFSDRLTNAIVASTSKVPPTPRRLHIREN